MPNNQPDLWGATDKYEMYMGRWSKEVAPLFLKWLNAPSQKSWIDIGCSTSLGNQGKGTRLTILIA